MKTELTTEQSNHLIELGVPKELASSSTYVESGKFVAGIELPPVETPIFKLDDLLEILESMKDCDFTIKHWKDGEQDVWTCEIEERVNSHSYSHELIDALYELTVWCLKEQHLKFD